MKIAYIILAHRYPDQLIRLILRLNTGETSFFVHIDKKTNDKIYHQIASGLSHLPNVYFLNRHKCYWGDFGHVNATIEGIKAIFNRNISFDWLILSTGQDYPIKSNNQIKEFLDSNEGKQFIEYEDYRVPPDKSWLTSGSDRIDYWHLSLGKMRLVFPAKLTASTANRNRLKKLIWLRFFSFLWSGLMLFFPPIKRRFPEGFQPFIGSAYWCLSRECVEYIHKFIQQNSDFVKFFKYVDNPDEMFFQTIILNSHFKESVINDNLYYVDWENPNPSSPRTFVKIDFERLANSSKLIARKFSLTRDADILDMIDKKILNDAS
jgi:hypothetical protein